MNCADLHNVLPDIMEGGRTAEQEMHLRSCVTCSDLVSDLIAISRGAPALQGSDEPSPRVWNAIAIALREEGLIRTPQSRPALAASSHWARAWLLPVAAAFLLAFGIVRYERGLDSQRMAQSAAPTTVSAVNPSPAAPLALAIDRDDDELLQVVSSRSPSLRASYEAELRSANAYIRDAEQSAHTNPNDEEAQQYLMNAYEQKSMVYEMALDRSLP